MTDFPTKQNNPAGATPVYLTAQPQGGATPANIAANGNHLVKTGAGTFLGLSVNTGVAGSTAKVYDGIDNTGTLIATISTAAVGSVSFAPCGVNLAVGLFIVTAGSSAADVTALYK